MLLDALLAYAHWVAILTLAVFSTSQAALCRPEWLNEAAVHRLVTVERVYRAALLAVVFTGAARWLWGVKGPEVVAAQPWLHAKLGLFVVMAVGAWRPMRAYRRWSQALQAGQGLPAPGEVQATRRSVMRASHLMLVLPLLAALMSRGIGWTG